MKFEILVCTLESRRTMLDQLIHSLKNQPKDPGVDVGVIVSRDDGRCPVGYKRQNLLGQATGDYVAFIDDDDSVAPNYVQRICGALVTHPDCVGIQGQIKTDGGSPQLFEHSIRHDKWFTLNGAYYRSPNHLNPVRRELALEAGFKASRFGEDHDFSRRLQTFLKTEVMLHGPIYFYNFWRKK